jgi:hypothetical protein
MAFGYGLMLEQSVLLGQCMAGNALIGGRVTLRSGPRRSGPRRIGSFGARAPPSGSVSEYSRLCGGDYKFVLELVVFIIGLRIASLW